MRCVKTLLAAGMALVSISCAQKTDYPPEIVELQKIAQDKPKDVTVCRNYVKALYEKEFYKDALEYSQKILLIDPKDYYGYLYTGLSNEKLMKWDEAEKYYKELCGKYPETGEGYYRLAVLQYKTGEYTESISNLEKAAAMEVLDAPKYIDMMNFLAEAYYYNNDLKKAYNLLDKALELSPFNKDILYNYGVWLLREGKYKESIQFLNKLISQNPQEAFPYIRLGKAYYNLHEMEQAEKAFWDASRFDSTVKALAEIVHIQDTDSVYKNINTAMVKIGEKYDYKRGDKYYVRGIAENIGLETAEWVTIIVKFYDKKDNLISQKVFESSPKNIRPEQYIFFKAEIPYSENISYVKIEPNWHKRNVSVYLK